MLRWQLKVVVVCMILVHYGETVERIDIENLYMDLLLLNPSEMRQNVRPSPHTEVNGSLSLLSVNSLDEISGMFSVMATLTLSWQDDRLTWNPVTYRDITNITLPMSKVWTPSVIMRNSAKKVKILGFENNVVTVFNTGKVILNIGDFLETSCSFDVKHFPFDRQNCDILFVPWLYSNNSVGFKQRVNSIDLNLFSENGMWEIIGTKASVQYIKLPLASPDEVYAELKYSIEMKRRSSYFVLTIFTPVEVLLILNSAVFILPTESGERVGYSITCLLALAVFLTLTSEVLPKTSEPLSVLYCFLMLLVMNSALICLMTIITIWLHHKDENSPMPMYLKKFTHFMINLNLTRCRKTVARCRKTININETDASTKERPTSKIEFEPKLFLVNNDEKENPNGVLFVKPAPVQIDNENQYPENTDMEELYSNITWKMFAELFNFLCLVFTLFLSGTLGSIYILITRGNL